VSINLRVKQDSSSPMMADEPKIIVTFCGYTKLASKVSQFGWSEA